MSDESEATAPAPNVELPLWRRLLPIVVGAALVAYLLSTLDFDAFRRALAKIHYVGYLAFTFFFVIALLTADSFAGAHVFTKTVGKISVRELWVIRGASYLPSLINHHVGQAWLTYYVSRVRGAPVWRVAGATLVIYVTTFGCLFVLAGAGFLVGAARLPWLAPTLGALGVLAAGYALVIWLAPEALAKRRALAAPFELGLSGQVIAMLYRMPHVLVQLLGGWLAFGFFGVDIPFSVALAYLPAVMLVQTLPITPQGVGTRDVVALELFASYAQGSPDQQRATIAAVTLSWAVGLTLAQLLISPPLLRRAQRLLRG